jgi:hypothetical protein
MTKNVIYLSIKKDSEPDRTRTVILKMRIRNDRDAEVPENTNKGAFKQIIVNVSGIKQPLDSLKSYNYLTYIETNFDLVDGAKAKNVFFATNVFLRPEAKKNVGVYLSLYGNRTMSTTDSFSNVYRTRLVPYTTTSHYSINEKGSLLRTQVSDNIGAYISPVINLWGASSTSAPMQLYYTPSLEFIWRRTNTELTYNNYDKGGDTIIRTNPIWTETTTVDDKTSVNINEFSFNIGLIGLMLVHENQSISVRVQTSVGWSSMYGPDDNSSKVISYNGNKSWVTTSDIFFAGRAWITEATTGLTLQAEITNTLKYPRPFYGVTLSKAINFKNLGKIFQPIVPKPAG